MPHCCWFTNTFMSTHWIYVVLFVLFIYKQAVKTLLNCHYHIWWCFDSTKYLIFQFVADGVFKAELNNFLTRELAEDGYSGVEVRVTPTRTEIIILATRTQNVLGEKGRRIRELTSVVQKRFGFPEGTVEVHTVDAIMCFKSSIFICYVRRKNLLKNAERKCSCWGLFAKTASHNCV